MDATLNEATYTVGWFEFRSSSSSSCCYCRMPHGTAIIWACIDARCERFWTRLEANRTRTCNSHA